MKDECVRRETCRMCGSVEIRRVLSLTPTPPGNNFLERGDLDREEKRYPLELHLCAVCNHVQLGHVVHPTILYQNDYLYVSGTSAHFVRHLREYANYVVDRFGLRPDDLVVDIGSNDGTCLRGFKDLGLRVLGVDPASGIAEVATDQGIPTVAAFFTESLAADLHEQHGPARLVTSHNSCAHIDDLDDVMRGVARLLAADGVLVIEVGYFVDVYEKMSFDTIYHEHLDYHTVGPFEHLLQRHGMELIGTERIEPQGGSIRIIAQKAGGARPVDPAVAELKRLEERMGLGNPNTFEEYGKRIALAGGKLRELLKSRRGDGRTVAAYGAPTKSTTLLAHFEIGRDLIDFMVDDNPMKQGRYSPTSHIPIVPSEEIYRRRPDYLVILAWNFAGPIIQMHRRFMEEGGRFVVPLPDPHLVPD